MTEPLSVAERRDAISRARALHLRVIDHNASAQVKSLLNTISGILGSYIGAVTFLWLLPATNDVGLFFAAWVAIFVLVMINLSFSEGIHSNPIGLLGSEREVFEQIPEEIRSLFDWGEISARRYAVGVNAIVYKLGVVWPMSSIVAGGLTYLLVRWLSRLLG